MSRWKQFAKSRIGISWQHPLVRIGLPFIDAADWIVRRANGHVNLPRYSIRIRSRGVERMFGGSFTARSSEYFRGILIQRAGLMPDSRVLDVGCGCGLTALCLASYLDAGHYTGLDIDRSSILAALRNRRLLDVGFDFQWIDVANDAYPGGSQPANSYRFPVSDGEFTHAILTSVFTHMLPDEVFNYLRELRRMLRPDGVLVFSMFLTDFGPGDGVWQFRRQGAGFSYVDAALPVKGVGYSLHELDALLEATSFVRTSYMLGDWRKSANVAPEVNTGQDVVIAVPSHRATV